MIIYVDYESTQKAKVVSKQLHEAGIGWKNIRNEYLDSIWYRIIVIPKTKIEKVLKQFPQIKEGLPNKWVTSLGTTHYWDEDFE